MSFESIDYRDRVLDNIVKNRFGQETVGLVFQAIYLITSTICSSRYYTALRWSYKFVAVPELLEWFSYFLARLFYLSSALEGACHYGTPSYNVTLQFKLGSAFALCTFGNIYLISANQRY